MIIDNRESLDKFLKATDEYKLIEWITFQHMKAWFYTLDPTTLEALAYALSRCKSLKHLNLNDNNLGALDVPGFQALSTILTRCKIQKISLAGNNLGVLNETGFQALGTALSQCKRLQTLQLGSNQFERFTTTMFEALGTALAQCHSLQTIDLIANNLGFLEPTQLKALGAAFSQCKTLQTINIMLNKLASLDVMGFQALGTALSQCDTLQQIKLDDNNLDALDPTRFQALYSPLSESKLLIQIEGILQFSPKRKKSLTDIFEKNKNYMDGFEPALKAGMPDYPDNLQKIILTYITPPGMLYQYHKDIKSKETEEKEAPLHDQKMKKQS